MDTVLGIDVGSSSVKASLLSIDGTVMFSAATTVELCRGHDGSVEQDMRAVWDAVVLVVSKVVAESPGKVLSVGVTGQGDGAWFVDSQGEPVANAAIWMDGRAQGVLEDWRRDGRTEILESATWSAAFPGAFPILGDWWQRQRPVELEEVRWHLNAKDWVGFRLTGVVATDPTEAARTLMPMSSWLDGVLEYDVALAAELGVQDLVQYLPPILSSTSIRGEVNSSAARSLGLQAGIPVVVGTLDGVSGARGMGASGEGKGFAIVGTTASYGTVTQERPTDGQPKGIWVPAASAGHCHATLAPSSGAPTFGWMRNMVAPDASLAAFEALAASIEPVTHGVLVLPHLSTGGQRAPFVDANARASIHGLSFATTPADVARATFEGVSYVMADCFDLLPSIDSITLGGGGSRSKLLGQIAADVTGVPILLSDVQEPGVRGVAAMAAGAIGVSMPIEQSGEWLSPRTEFSELYAAARKAEKVVRSESNVGWAHLAKLRGL